MRFLPVFLDLSSGHVIIAGSGPQATAKLQLLCAAGASVRWFSPHADVAEELLVASHHAGHIGITIGEPVESDIVGALALVSAAGNEIDERLAARARALSVPVNVVDRPDLSTFIFPAVVDRGDVVVAIGTGGASPVLARRLRERIEAILPARIGEFANFMMRYRERLSVVRRFGFSLRRFWERVIDGPIGAAFLAGRTREAEAALLRAIEDAASLRRANRAWCIWSGPDPATPIF